MKRLLVVLLAGLVLLSACSENSKGTQKTFTNKTYDYIIKYPASWAIDSQESRHININASDDVPMGIGISIHQIIESPFEDKKDDRWESKFKDYVDEQVNAFRKDHSFSAVVFDRSLQQSGYSAREVGLVFEIPDIKDMMQSKSLYILHYPYIYQIYGMTRRDQYEDFVAILDQSISSFSLNEVIGGYTAVEWEQVQIELGIIGLFLRSQSYLDDSYREIDTEEEMKAITSGKGKYHLYDYLGKLDYPLRQAYDIREDGAIYIH